MGLALPACEPVPLAPLPPPAIPVWHHFTSKTTNAYTSVQLAPLEIWTHAPVFRAWALALPARLQAPIALSVFLLRLSTKMGVWITARLLTLWWVDHAEHAPIASTAWMLRPAFNANLASTSTTEPVMWVVRLRLPSSMMSPTPAANAMKPAGPARALPKTVPPVLVSLIYTRAAVSHNVLAASYRIRSRAHANSPSSATSFTSPSPSSLYSSSSSASPPNVCTLNQKTSQLWGES